MCPRIDDSWRADERRRRKIPILGPVAWWLAVAMCFSAIVCFVVLYLVILVGWGAPGAWGIVVIMLASIGFIIAVPAVLGWVARRIKRRRTPGQKIDPT
jgi:hypothetical protein